MDLSQIAQIKGSLTNFMQANPDFATALFSNYADNSTWLQGSGKPLINGVANNFYIDTDNGDVYFAPEDGPFIVWQYLCNYFESSQSRIVPMRFNASGLVDNTLVTWDIVTLAADEYITMVCTESIEKWIPNGVNSIYSLQLFDSTNSLALRELSNGKAGMSCNNINRVYPEQVVCGVQNVIHTSRVISLFMQCTTTEGFSAGETIIYLKIEKLRPTDMVTAPN